MVQVSVKKSKRKIGKAYRNVTKIRKLRKLHRKKLKRNRNKRS